MAKVKLRAELTQLVMIEAPRTAKLVAEILGGRGEINQATEKRLMNTQLHRIAGLR
jgi:hypothetical protein